ncbi:MAG: ribonuclease [Lachnospiraceae bacterium]|nr:ribonuclease [Lachnospiraceae bacterium]
MKKKISALLFTLLLSLQLTACSEKQPVYDLARDVNYPTETVNEADTYATEPQNATQKDGISEDGVYDDADSVAEYIHIYGKLPSNYMTKKEAQKLGWEGGSLEEYATGMCIGGDYYGNYEGLLPDKKGRKYYECDIDTIGKQKRGAKRIIYSDDGLIYYTDDHYASFTLLYGTE